MGSRKTILIKTPNAKPETSICSLRKSDVEEIEEMLIDHVKKIASTEYGLEKIITLVVNYMMLHDLKFLEPLCDIRYKR